MPTRSIVVLASPHPQAMSASESSSRGMSICLDRRETWPNQSAAANRRPAGQLDGSGNLAAIVAADRAFPAAVAELGR